MNAWAISKRMPVEKTSWECVLDWLKGGIFPPGRDVRARVGQLEARRFALAVLPLGNDFHP